MVRAGACTISNGMERIIIKPTAKEIVFRGKPEEGHVDVFSYNYEGGGQNGLGSLFIVGQVQPATEDTSYMINLVASLAKREYYAQPDIAPKESFSKTLKKINEVLQDFFRNKDIKVNIGIFTVAGENIFISRLGKFKIILSRDNQNIDILNNINLFNKEHIQEKEFSNIISGRIAPQDKIFAFYPGRSIVAREKNIKADLLKLGADDFTEKLGTIRKNNENFLCAGIHISINKHTEPAIIIPPQPKELRSESPQAMLAKISKTTKEKLPIIAQELSNVVSPLKQSESPIPQSQEEPSLIKIKPASPSQPLTPPTEDLNKSSVYYPGNQNLSAGAQQSKSVEPEPPPLIRPSEFSSAKKENFLNIILKKYKPSGIYIIGQRPVFTKKKLILTVSLITAIVAAGITVKLTFLPSLPIPGIDSEQNKATNALLKQIQSKLEAAQAYKNQNNLLEARRALLDSLSSVATSNFQDKNLQKAKGELLSLLDQIDKAVDIAPNLLYQVSSEIGNASLLVFAKDKILVYASSLTEADSGTVLTTSESGVESTAKVANFNPLYLIGGNQLVVMINKVADKIASLTTKTGDVKTSSLALSGSVISVYPYQGNLYVLTSDGIYKINDADQGKSTPVSWLNKDVHLPPQPALIATDGKIFVISKSGYLTIYYKGDKRSEVNTSIPVDTESALLTTPESSFLYLVDKKMGRIYILNKSSGNLEKTVKLNNDQPLVSASISDSGTIYLLTSDNKVWKIAP